ncbi:MAG TPA: hypothetical protein VIF15_20815 [Polyangiaceae bacterium]|jgi:hypothetical protein
MKRVLGHVLAGLSLLAGVGVAISACAHDNSTLFVQNVLAPQLVTNGNVCVFTAQPTQTFISSGVLDVAFRQEYDPTYLVANQSVPEVNSSQLQTETATVNIQGAVVRITDAAGKQLTTFTRLAGATIYPALGGVPSYAPISVTTLDSTTVNANLPPAGGTVRLVTYVKFFGQNLGGTSVESGEFEFPVDLCRGCLINFSPQDISGCYNAPNCQGSTTSGGQSAATLPEPCIPGQDYAIDCVQCQSIPECHPNLLPYLCNDAGGGG